MVFKVLKGYGMSLLLFFVLSAICAVIIAFTGVPESAGMILIFAVMSVSCLFMGIYAGGSMSFPGILCGFACSLFLMISVIVPVALCIHSPLLPGTDDLKLLIPLLVGTIGGAVGKNMSD